MQDIEIIQSSSKIIISFKVDPKDKIIIYTKSTNPGFYIIYYTLNEPENPPIVIEPGIVEINEIRNHHNRIIKLLEESFTNNNPVSLFIKSENCMINVDGAEKTDLFHIFYSESSNKTINVFLDDQDLGENELCTFYTYTFDNFTSNNIVLIEGIFFNLIFDENLKNVTLQYPFVYDDSVEDRIIFDVRFITLSPIVILIKYPNQEEKSYELLYLTSDSQFELSKTYKTYCHPKDICDLRFFIYPIDINAEIQFSLQINDNDFIPIQSNKEFIDKT